MKQHIALLPFLIICFSFQASAQYYWVGGTGNWSDPTHWATSSGGSNFHAEPPTSADDVIFDTNSFDNGGQTVTMDVAQGECKSMTWANVTNNPGFNSSSPEILNIYGDLTLSPDMTCNLRFVEMESSETVSITTSGTNLGTSSILRINGTGTVNLTDVVNVREFQVYSGTFNTNNNTINCEFAFRTSGNLPMTLNMGTSTLNIRQWRMSGTSVTLDMGMCTVNCQSFYGDETGSGPYTYGDLIIEDGGILNGTSTFNNITLLNQLGINSVRIGSGAVITCKQLTAQGTRYSPLELEASSEGQEATISQANGSVTADYLILKDIHAQGGANFTTMNSVDLGNNDGWNINAVEIMDMYWVGGDGIWTDPTHWATTSGGNSFYDRFPSQFDNAIFDENSFTGENQSVTLDTASQVRDMNWEGVQFRPRLSRIDFYHSLSVYGSLNLTDSVFLSVASINMTGTGTGKTCNIGNDNALSNLSFWGDGEWTLTSNVTCGNFSAYAGYVNTNNKTIDVSFSFTIGNTRGASIDMTDSDITALRFKIRNEQNEFDAGTSHITALEEFEGSGFDFYEVTLADNVDVLNSNTFEILHVAQGASVSFEADSVQTITSELNLNGVPTAPISLSSATEGTQTTLSKASGTVDGIYLVLQDMNATGGATFNADQSIDNGNNTGWNIEEVVPLDFYWVGGSGNWSDAKTHWAKSSGGNQFYQFAPGPVDNVYFDSNSFSAIGQELTLDVEQINFNNMDWSGVTEMPSVSGFDATINIYGSILLAPLTNIDVRFYNFLSNEQEQINFGDPTFPGTNSFLTFSGGGTWNLQDSMTTRELVLQSGTINTNNHGLHVDFQTMIEGPDQKSINLGTSNYYTRIFQWGGVGSDNLAFDGSSAHVFCSSSFNLNSVTIEQPDEVTINELTFIASQDAARIFGDLKVNKLTIEPGKDVSFFSGHTIYFDELVANGTQDAFIILRGQTEGSQALFVKTDGVVDAEYLELKDISATGGAEFNAYNSINNGNVSGWNFFGQAQSIDFDDIDDRSETAGSFSIAATASSGLPVTLEIISGPATVDGNQLTLTGAGEVQVKASQEGDINFNPAPSEIRTFCSVPVKPSITIDDNDPSILISSRDAGNQWLRDGQVIAGAQDQTLVATQSGLYSVQSIFGMCISEISDEVQVTITSATSASLGELKTWPNPATSSLYVEMGERHIDGFGIYDVMGRLIKRQNVSLARSSTLDIDVSSLESGVYILIMHSGDKFYQKKWIKQD